MHPRTSHPAPKSLLGAALFSACCGLITGQSPVPNQVFAGAERGQGFSVQQDGARGFLIGNSTLTGPVRLAPDGTPWSLAIVTAGAPPTAVAFRSTPTNVLIPGFIAQNLPGTPTDLVVTAENRALVCTDSGSLVELDRVSGSTFQTFPLSGPGRALEIDEQGRAWVGVDNMPAPVLQRIDRPNGTSSLVTVPGAGLGITRILADGRAGGSHLYVVRAENPGLFEFDANLSLVTRHALPGVPTDANIIQLELALDGSIWVLVEDAGLWRFNPASGAFEAKLTTDALASFGFDAHGVLWVTRFVGPGAAVEIGPVDVPTLEVGPSQRVPGAAGVPVMRDVAGLHIAQVLDQAGDSDGDGFANRAEIDARSNPFDANSTPVLDLEARLDVPGNADLVVQLRGRLGVGVVAFGFRRGAPIALPGIDGNFLLDPNAVLGTPVNVLVPGVLRIPTPDLPTTSQIYAQALNLPVVGTPRFSDRAPINLRPENQLQVVESFLTTTRRDDAASAGDWSGGSLRGAEVGGRGLLGEFDFRAGQQVDTNTWRFDTDRQLFTTNTLFGVPVVVAGGVFEFETMVIPAGITVQFRGTRPAVIKVRGDVRIEGTLDVNGSSVPPGFDPRSVFDPISGGFVGAPGQTGALGGPGAGAGGNGGVGCEGNGQIARSTGDFGEPIQAPATSGYAAAMGRMATAGRGAAPFPANAQDGSVVYRLFGSITTQLGAGGGGGSFLGVGTGGQAIRSASSQIADLGPPTLGSSTVPFLAPAGVSSLEHFLVGGAGGGGGGSHPSNMSSQQINFEQRAWHAGNAGAGGGGAVALRVGDDLVVGASGLVSALGGSGIRDTDRSQGPAMPGGGGSGGSILIQTVSNNRLTQNGVLDVSGGQGGSADSIQFNGQQSLTEGGDGGHGLVRFEAAAGATVGQLGQVDGPATLGADNVGTLTDRDAWSGSRSTFYEVTDVTPPNWERFIVQVQFNGFNLAFSDDPSVGPSPNLPGQPIRLYVQGGRFDPTTGAVEPTGPFRDTVSGLNQDDATHVRFVALFDGTVDPNSSISRVEIFARR